METPNIISEDIEYYEDKDEDEDYLLNRKLKRDVRKDETIELSSFLIGDLNTLIFRVIEFIKENYDPQYDSQKIDYTDSDYVDDPFRLISYKLETKKEYDDRIKRSRTLIRNKVYSAKETLDELTFLTPEDKQTIIDIIDKGGI